VEKEDEVLSHITVEQLKEIVTGSLKQLFLIGAALWGIVSFFLYRELQTIDEAVQTVDKHSTEITVLQYQSMQQMNFNDALLNMNQQDKAEVRADIQKLREQYSDLNSRMTYSNRSN
jgi:hypothetical protein